jgi:hypothetical protein
MMELIDYLISAICLFGIGMAFIRLYFVIKEYRSSSVANEPTKKVKK